MKLFGLIGYPLGHSFSKQYFTEKFLKEGIVDSSFEAFPIPSIDEFTGLVKANPNLLGLSVTIPYKTTVLPFIDELSEEVKFIGATNSIKFQDGKSIAYNTDIIGFKESFSRHLQPHHTNALVLGSGGASKAVQYVLKNLGIDYKVVSRQPTGIGQIAYEEINKTVLEKYTVIINCSPTGMWPNVEESPAIPYEFLTPAHYLYDLVYKPIKTLFLEKGEDKGAIVENGYDMLILQAEASWKIWNDL